MIPAQVEAASIQEPVHGGGAGPGYAWRQTTNLVRAICPVPPGTRGRDVLVDVASATLTAKLRDGSTSFFARAPLHRSVRPEETLWELSDDDGSLALVITLEKLDRTHGSRRGKFGARSSG